MILILLKSFFARRISRAFICGVDQVSTTSGLPDIVKSIFNWPINQSTSIMIFLNLVLLHVVFEQLSDAGLIGPVSWVVLEWLLFEKWWYIPTYLYILYRAFLEKSPNDTYLYLENYNSDCPEILNTYGICKWHLTCNFSTSYVINFLCKQPLENPGFVN